jgi:hypothetical protein
MGSIVAVGDTDIGTAITLPTKDLKKTGAAAATFIYGIDGAYIDLDLSGTVTVGDTRLAIGNTVANGSDYVVSSIVLPGDTDIGTVIVLPTGCCMYMTPSILPPILLSIPH